MCAVEDMAVNAFMICRGLCACTEMLWMCVLYVNFGSKVRPRTFGCVAMGSALLCIIGPDSSYILKGLDCDDICMCARRIPAHLRCTQCSTLLHLIAILYLSTMYLFMADIANPDLFYEQVSTQFAQQFVTAVTPHRL